VLIWKHVSKLHIIGLFHYVQYIMVDTSHGRFSASYLIRHPTLPKELSSPH
jgi:hypothetical protein